MVKITLDFLSSYVYYLHLFEILNVTKFIVHNYKPCLRVTFIVAIDLFVSHVSLI